MSLKTVYERQKAAEAADLEARQIREDLYFNADPRAREGLGFDLSKHPDVVAARERVDALKLEVAALREQVNGRVYRVLNVKLAELEERIAKLNKKAAKYGTGEITLVVSGEREQVVQKRDGREWVLDFTFVTVDGRTPMIEGFVFVATLDHEAGPRRRRGRRHPPRACRHRPGQPDRRGSRSRRRGR